MDVTSRAGPAYVVVVLAVALGLAGAAVPARGVAAAAVPASGVVAAAVADAGVFAPRAEPGARTLVDVWCGAGATAASVDTTALGGPPEVPLRPHPDAGPGAFRTAIVVPFDARPGTYRLAASCDDGRASAGTLVVHRPLTAPPPGTDHHTRTYLLWLAGIAASVVAAALLRVRRPPTRPAT